MRAICVIIITCLVTCFTPIGVIADTDIATQDQIIDNYFIGQKLEKIETDIGILNDRISLIKMNDTLNKVSGDVKAEDKNKRNTVKIGIVYFSGLMGLWGLSTGGLYPTITGILFITSSYITATSLGE